MDEKIRKQIDFKHFAIFREIGFADEVIAGFHHAEDAETFIIAQGQARTGTSYAACTLGELEEELDKADA